MSSSVICMASQGLTCTCTLTLHICRHNDMIFREASLFVCTTNTDSLKVPKEELYRKGGKGGTSQPKHWIQQFDLHTPL